MGAWVWGRIPLSVRAVVGGVLVAANVWPLLLNRLPPAPPITDVAEAKR